MTNSLCRFDKLTLSFINIGKSCLKRDFFHITNVSFNGIRENKILAKISESTVLLHGVDNVFMIVKLPCLMSCYC